MEETTSINSLIWIGTGLMIGLALLFLILALFYQNHAVKTKRKTAELLLKSALESEQNERKRIAADLHDSLQGDLNALRNFLAILEKTNDRTTQVDLVQTSRKIVEMATENVVIITKKLMPPLLQNAGLLPALTEYFDYINQSTKATFRLETTKENPVLSQDTSYQLFRVLQEFTQNMLKHGGVTTCTIRFGTKKNNVCTIELLDDGTPYHYATAYANSSGSGLRNITSRLTSINATLIQKESQRGNYIFITLNTQKND